ncbi:ABC transporter permease [Nocardia sp. NPDC051570]|uniref:ABC transporter permease n=1 Tax=Nocardia sp. NPDC051570 TaxID=3364324 RepID=UPI0037BCBEB8
MLLTSDRTVRLARMRRRLCTAPEIIGHQATFAIAVLAAVPYALRHYRMTIVDLITDIVWGRWATGGTLLVLLFLGGAAGVTVGTEGYDALALVGLGPLTGFVSAYAVTRELAPVLVAVGFAAQAGCRMTAEIGAMRIGEEIDALESLAIRAVPFVVGTRLVAGLVAIVPLYLPALLIGFWSTGLVVRVLHGQSAGTYDHYFTTFLLPRDIAYSTVKAVVFVAIVILIHCYHGFYAQGGPEGVGRAAGRAVRAGLVAVVIANLLLTVVIWGISPNVEVVG